MCFNYAAMPNTLYYGDNLDILREHVPDGPRRAVNKAVVQVKSGKVSSPLIRDLVGTGPRPAPHP